MRAHASSIGSSLMRQARRVQPSHQMTSRTFTISVRAGFCDHDHSASNFACVGWMQMVTRAHALTTKRNTAMKRVQRRAETSPSMVNQLRVCSRVELWEFAEGHHVTRAAVGTGAAI